MTTLVGGKDKVKQICETLIHEALEPANAQVQKLLKDAESTARSIVNEAQERANKMLEDVRKKIEQERSAFLASLKQGGQQSLAALRQDVEERLFQPGLEHLLSQETSDSKILAKLLEVLVGAIQKDGLGADLEVIIPKTVPAKALLEALGTQVRAMFSEKDFLVGDFKGGIKIRIRDKKLTIDMTNQALCEVLGRYIRKDFREMLFHV